jgi:hypothetical protein
MKQIKNNGYIAITKHIINVLTNICWRVEHVFLL